MVSRCPGENAFLGSYKVGNCTQRRFSSCEGFLLPPHPQVRSPVSRKRFAHSYASLLIMERNTSVGNVPMCSASQTAFLTFSDPLLESARLRKNHKMTLTQPRCSAIYSTPTIRRSHPRSPHVEGHEHQFGAMHTAHPFLEAWSAALPLTNQLSHTLTR